MKPIFVIRKTISGKTTPVGWVSTEAEAKNEITQQMDALVKNHREGGEKVFVSKSTFGDSLCVFRQSLGFLYDGGLSQQETLSYVSVDHVNHKKKPKELTLRTTKQEDLAITLGTDFSMP